MPEQNLVNTLLSYPFHFYALAITMLFCFGSLGFGFYTMFLGKSPTSKSNALAGVGVTATAV